MDAGAVEHDVTVKGDSNHWPRVSERGTLPWLDCWTVGSDDLRSGPGLLPLLTGLSISLVEVTVSFLSSA